MTSALTREEFRAYVYALWSRQLAADFAQHYQARRPANRPTPGTAKDTFQRERTLLQTILTRTTTDETSTNKADVAYSQSDQAIFMSADAREEITGLDHDNARIYFTPRKPLAERYTRGSTNHNPVHVKDLLLVDQEFLRSELGVVTEEIPWSGQVVVKNVDGLTWIQLLRQHAPASPRITEVALDVGATVIVERLPCAPAAWWQRAESPISVQRSLEGEAFNTCCRDLLASLRREHGGIPVPPTIDASGVARSDEFAVVEICTPEITKEVLLDALRPAFAAGAPRRAVLIVICTKNNNDVEAAISDAMRHVGGAEIFIVIATLPEIQAQLSRHPWVWAEETMARFGFAAFPDEEKFARHARVEVLTDLQGPIVHPIVEQIGGDDNVILIGDPGAGTTTGIYHLLHRHRPGEPVIVVDTGTVRTHTAQMVEAIAVELFRERATVVTEHLERDLAFPPTQTTFADVLRLLGRDEFWFIVACAAAQQRATRVHFAEFFRHTFWKTTVLTASRAFLERVARASMAFLPLPSEDEFSKRIDRAIEASPGRSVEEEWKRAIDAVIEWDPTPGAARWLFSREPVIGVPFFTSRARRPSSHREQHEPDAELLLQLLFAAHVCWIKETTVPLMRWYFDAFGGGSESAFHRALLRLTEELHVRFDGGTMSIKAADFNPPALGLSIDGQLSPFLISFAQKTLRAPISESDTQPALVRCIELLASVADVTNTKDAIERLRACRPEFYAQWRGEIACSLAVVGLPDDAMALLEDLPTAYGWEKVIAVFCHKNEHDRARTALWHGVDRLSDVEAQTRLVLSARVMFVCNGWSDEAHETYVWLCKKGIVDPREDRVLEEYSEADRELVALWGPLLGWHPPSLS